MGFDVYYIEKNDYTFAVFLISHECKRAWIYFSELSSLLNIPNSN